MLDNILRSLKRQEESGLETVSTIIAFRHIVLHDLKQVTCQTQSKQGRVDRWGHLSTAGKILSTICRRRGKNWNI